MPDVVISRLTPRNGSTDKSQFLSEINIGTSRLTPRNGFTSDCYFFDGVYDCISKDIFCITFGTSDPMFLNLSIKLSVVVLNNINDAIYPWSDDSTATVYTETSPSTRSATRLLYLINLKLTSVINLAVNGRSLVDGQSCTHDHPRYV